MSDWIKVRANEIKSAERERKAERDRQTEAANVLRAKIEPFWRELVEVLKDSVDEFNAEFPEPERKIDLFEKTSTGVTIRRTAYPAVSARAQLNSAVTVNYTIARTQKKGAEPVEKQGNFVFGLTGGEASYVEGGITEHGDVAKLLLEPFFSF